LDMTLRLLRDADDDNVPMRRTHRS
jgi:hypothetical protein